jgi:hypothetical protein
MQIKVIDEAGLDAAEMEMFFLKKYFPKGSSKGRTVTMQKLLQLPIKEMQLLSPGMEMGNRNLSRSPSLKGKIKAFDSNRARSMFVRGFETDEPSEQQVNLPDIFLVPTMVRN